MLEKIKKFVFNHPNILEFTKRFLSNRYIANSWLYKYLVMKNAAKLHKKTNEYKHSIYIENTLSCNARCLFCAHSRQTMVGTMSMELYKKIIDECNECGINNVIFGIYGESLADQFLFERIDYLRKFGMNYGLVTNGSMLTPEKTDQLFKLGGLNYVNFSVNGYSREVYEKTMVGLKRDTTYENILYFLKQKEKFEVNDLVVNISAVQTKLNKKDLKKFFRFWKRKKGVYMILPVELIDRMGDEYDGEIGKLGPMTKKDNWLSPCRSLWGPLWIYFDGKVSPCCTNSDKRKIFVGDITKQTLKEIMLGKGLNDLRQLHLCNKRANHPVCGRCYLNSVWLGQ